ncbi:MAG: metallophosphoesterase [Acidobacteria bacterium]|nr:metallophosphoesterase [Acidobacteriota bacterium]MBS1865050.1 metallophosphoesterase [Acidobacteriota bacterium]
MFHGVNVVWLVARTLIGLGLISLLVYSQFFWYRGLWRVTANWRSTALRVLARVICLALAVVCALAFADGLRMGKNHWIPRGQVFPLFVGMWFTSAFFGFIAVKLVRGFDIIWGSAKRRIRASLQQKAKSPDARAGMEILADPGRRHFFKTATAVAGAAPFLGAVYGFAAERLNYQVRRVEIPLANLPDALDGMKIAQLSDIHLSGYISRDDVRRAVDMANDLAPDLSVVTGDFITSAGDPLSECIEEIRKLSGSLGIYGCNGNHEIYAKAEDAAERLFAQAGMKLLRSENAAINFRGAQLNLIGVDYQRERGPGGKRIETLAGAERLVRRDMPNILLSHNPNTFDRAAELGIELSLAGHTHGGQVQVEILDHRLSPARFITNYIAGLYTRPLGAASNSLDAPVKHSQLYVNRGLGTVGAPVRLGVPPEITLITLRRS